MAGAIKFPHTCPRCKVVKAENVKEGEEKFGYREEKSKKSYKLQSWCRECRRKYS